MRGTSRRDAAGRAWGLVVACALVSLWTPSCGPTTATPPAPAPLDAPWDEPGEVRPTREAINTYLRAANEANLELAYEERERTPGAEFLYELPSLRRLLRDALEERPDPAPEPARVNFDGDVVARGWRYRVYILHGVQQWGFSVPWGVTTGPTYSGGNPDADIIEFEGEAGPPRRPLYWIAFAWPDDPSGKEVWALTSDSRVHRRTWDTTGGAPVPADLLTYVVWPPGESRRQWLVPDETDWTKVQHPLDPDRMEEALESMLEDRPPEIEFGPEEPPEIEVR